GYHPAEFIDNGQCNSCGLCYQMCPDVAIEVWKD
ncbi:MAG: 2-oxoacid:acceptor oxidoreductase, partial [Clostridia bacterium]|nr:2-oxoacid:acceptor oxidoreductase [Clostridia bacterium]